MDNGTSTYSGRYRTAARDKTMETNKLPAMEAMLGVRRRIRGFGGNAAVPTILRPKACTMRVADVGRPGDAIARLPTDGATPIRSFDFQTRQADGKLTASLKSDSKSRLLPLRRHRRASSAYKV